MAATERHVRRRAQRRSEAPVATFVRGTGASTPAVMTTCAAAQSVRGGTSRPKRAAAAVDAAAASPKTGQVQANTAGSGTTWRAAAGRNVAGTM